MLNYVNKNNVFSESPSLANVLESVHLIIH